MSIPGLCLYFSFLLSLSDSLTDGASVIYEVAANPGVFFIVGISIIILRARANTEFMERGKKAPPLLTWNFCSILGLAIS